MSKREIHKNGLIAITILVVVFGMPPFYEWIPRNFGEGDPVGFLLNQLTWPKYHFTPNGDWLGYIALLVRAALVILVTYLILASSKGGVKSKGVAFIVGWVAVILGAATAAFVSSFIGENNVTFSDLANRALAAFQAGGSYGLFVGWIVGIVTSRSKI
jgi:hypothetical protein